MVSALEMLGYAILACWLVAIWYFTNLEWHIKRTRPELYQKMVFAGNLLPTRVFWNFYLGRETFGDPIVIELKHKTRRWLLISLVFLILSGIAAYASL